MQKIMHGIKKYMLLERLELTALRLSDLCYVLLTTPSITSGIVDKKIRALERERDRAGNNADKRQRVRVWLSKLKRDGFIEHTGIVWKITKVGRIELDRLRRRIGLTAAYANPLKSNTVKIISFDIPEKMRSHRDWLRAALKNLGFTILHQSVWMGTILLPEDFIKEIQFRRLTDYIEIMSVTKEGTIAKERLLKR